MEPRHVLRSLPGVAATVLMIGMTTAAAVTGTASLFYEAWGQPWPKALPYFAPAAVLMAIGLLALRRPRAGSGLAAAVAIGAGGYWLRAQLGRGMAAPQDLAIQAALMTSPIVFAALLFLFEARHQRLLFEEGGARPARWIARHWRAALLVAVPLAATAWMAALQLPALLARHDDGLRTARTIRSGEITLVWAPSGPGWNRLDAGGAYPAWNALLRHGPLGQDRCAYLSEDGMALLDAPVSRWRMPTAHEIIGALSRGGSGAGCTWDGRSPHASCRVPPDKETPLWAPDQPPIYYWSGQEASAGTAFAVNYTGGISVLPKSNRGLGVGFRCVKPEASQRGSPPAPAVRNP